MKQYLMPTQWDEITSEQRCDFLRVIGELKDDHVAGVGLVLPLPTIGHLIQFLDEYITTGWWHIEREGSKQGWRVQSKNVDFSECDKYELIDALWEAVKQSLSEEESTK